MKSSLQNYRQRLFHSPAGDNEFYMLELPWLRNPQAIQELGDIIRAQDPAVVFLAETWLDEARLKRLCDKLNLKKVFGVSRITRGDGLSLF